MLDLALQINGCGFRLGQSVNWASFNRTTKFRNEAALGPKVKVRKLGWFGRWHEGAAQKEDQLYKLSGCRIDILGGKFGLIPIDASSPFGPCSTTVSLYLQSNFLRKVNVVAISPNIPRNGLPGRSETLTREFYTQCSAVFGEPSVLPSGGGSQPGEEAFVWSDSESIVKSSTFYESAFVVMWELLQPA